MKKAVAFIVITFSLCCLLCSCSQGKISENKIEKDMNDYFCNENFTVENITIKKSRRVEKNDTIDVAVDIKNENVSGKRSYTLTYNKYSQGGWQLDDCTPLDQWAWEAETVEIPDVSNEYLASCLFEEAKVSGYVLTDKVQGSVFSLWTSDGETIDNPENYITDVTHSFDDKYYTADVKISAESSVFGIEETIRFVWNFNTITLNWEEPFINSISANCNAKLDLIGEYSNERSSRLIPRVKIVSVADDGTITTVDWNGNHEYSLKGTRCVSGASKNSRAITFLDDRFKYGINEYVYYYEDKTNID